MGYYSIYLIIKDILRTLFRKKKKTIIFLLFLIFLFFFFKTTSYGAYEFDYNSFGVQATITIPDTIKDYNYVLLTTNRAYNLNNSLGYVFAVSKSNITMRFDSGNYMFLRSPSSIVFLYPATTPYWSNNGFFGSTEFNKLVTGISNASTPTTWYTSNGSGFSGFSNIANTSFYGNCNIYNTDGTIRYEANVGKNPPEITNIQEDLESLDFDFLTLVTNDYYQEDVYLFTYDLTGVSNNTFDNVPYRKSFLLNSNSEYYMSTISSNNGNYWIPIDKLGITFRKTGFYGFRFAIKDDNGNFEYITDFSTFGVSGTVSDDLVNNINTYISDTQQKEQTDILNQIISNNYDENQISNTLTDIAAPVNDFDDYNYPSLFTTLFSKLSNLLNNNYDLVEEIVLPLPHGNSNIVIRSDLVSSHIQNTNLYLIIQYFWYYVFGLYIYRFSTDIIIKIKSGQILMGYKNNNEVITSSML